MNIDMMRIVIVGAGRGGAAILEVLYDDKNIEIVAIVDSNKEAVAFRLARECGISVVCSIEDAPNCDIAINVTGSSQVSDQLHQHYGAAVEVMEGEAARFFYDQICKRRHEKEQVERMLADFEHLNKVGHRLNMTSHLEEMLKLVLNEAMRVTESPAGTVSLYNKDTKSLSLRVSIGFSEGFKKQEAWVVREGGLTQRILNECKPFAVGNIAESEGFNLNLILEKEGVQALIAVPLVLGSDIVGILYVNDFSTRKFTDDQICILDLLGNEAAHAIQKVRLFDEVKQEKEELKSLNDELESRVMSRTRELTLANDELVRTSQAKSQFISNMSHELRTPLTSINGFSELLIDELFGPLNEAQAKYLKNINVSGKHLLELINGILDLAKIESGKMSIKLEVVNVEKLFNEVMLVLEGYANKANVRLKLEHQVEIPSVLLDRTKFKQILYNLSSNAIKFSPEGSEVSIHTNYDTSSFLTGNQEAYASLSVAVKDQGIGIAAEDLETIFNPFEQVDGTHSRNFEGTGLGLTLTKRLVDMHGGQITVESAQGEGSCFTFTLPIETELPTQPLLPVTTDVADRQERAAIAKPSRKPVPVAADAPLILVVDDDANSLEVNTLYLTEAGYRVCHAMNGDDALEMARKKRPFLIMLDVMMPGKDGWEVLQELKLDAETADIPVMMCTVSENEELGVALGATDYLSKPIDRNLLANKLKSLGRGKLRKHQTMHVLAVDDDEQIRELYEATLSQQGYRVHCAANGHEALQMAESIEPDIIILDLMMPGMDGFEVAERLKGQPKTQHIPIIVVTAKELTIAERMRLMGHIEDCVSKESFSKEGLLNEIKQFETVYPQRAGLKDSVSGLLNHRYFQIRLGQEMSRSQRSKQPLACVLFDLDNFARFSELAGEGYGHSALRKVGDFLIKNLRGSDIATRYRIDEFAMILNQTELEAAVFVVNRFKSMIEAYPFPREEELGKDGLTACAAIAMFPEDGDTPEKLMQSCQALIQDAKGKGKNTLVYRKNGQVIFK